MEPRRAVFVAMGEAAVAKEPGTLVIRGLGSCIALALHDPLQRLAGLAHVVIPRPLPNTPRQPAWAATDAVPALVAMMEAQGGRRGRLVARLAGGASMFPGAKKGYDVGQENAATVEALLKAYGIPVLSSQVGGHTSRNVRLHPEDGRLDVQAAPVRALPAADDGGDDPREAVRILLEAAAAPLADFLERPVVVRGAGAHDLSRADVAAFLGPRTTMRWSRLPYDALAGPRELHLAVPDLHARRIDEELRGRLPSPLEEGAAIDEVLGVMATHALTALSRLAGATLRPRAGGVQEGRTPDLLAALPFGAGGVVRAAHARLHVEGAFHGADLAVFGAEVP